MRNVPVVDKVETFLFVKGKGRCRVWKPMSVQPQLCFSLTGKPQLQAPGLHVQPAHQQWLIASGHPHEGECFLFVTLLREEDSQVSHGWCTPQNASQLLLHILHQAVPTLFSLENIKELFGSSCPQIGSGWVLSCPLFPASGLTSVGQLPRILHRA